MKVERETEGRVSGREGGQERCRERRKDTTRGIDKRAAREVDELNEEAGESTDDGPRDVHTYNGPF